MQLKELISNLAPLRVEGPTETEVSGVTYDSRRVTPGTVFVAIRGAHVDGHDFISSAIDRGAAAIVCERNGFTSQRATKVKVADARQALAQAARHALAEAFGPRGSRLAESVQAAQVVAVLQGVPGLTGVLLQALYLQGDQPSLQAGLAANDLAWDPLQGALVPAELLLPDTKGGVVLNVEDAP